MAGRFPLLLDEHVPRSLEQALRQRGWALRAEWQELAGVAATIENASATARQLSEARERLAREAARVYIDPSQVIGRLTADPHASARFSAGQAAAYGQLKSRGESLFRQPDSARRLAHGAVPSAQRPRRLSGGRKSRRPGAGPREFHQREPTRVARPVGPAESTIQRVEQTMKGPEKAIEAIVREVGLQGARLALAVLPRPVHLPVESPSGLWRVCWISASDWAVEGFLDHHGTHRLESIPCSHLREGSSPHARS
jgi:hypothetical protein